MNEAEQQIEELEIKAAESDLIANLATDRTARVYNSRLAKELNEMVHELRASSHPEQPTIPDAAHASQSAHLSGSGV
jgi:dynactin complex subunit